MLTKWCWQKRRKGTLFWDQLGESFCILLPTSLFPAGCALFKVNNTLSMLPEQHHALQQPPTQSHPAPSNLPLPWGMCTASGRDTTAPLQPNEFRHSRTSFVSVEENWEAECVCFSHLNPEEMTISQHLHANYRLFFCTESWGFVCFLHRKTVWHWQSNKETPHS